MANPYYNQPRPAMHGGPGYNPFAMAYALRRAYPMVGAADPAAAPAATTDKSFIDKGTDFLKEENSLLKVKNGYILGLAALVGLGIYGHSQRWF